MAYTCPVCGVTSYNPNDERHRYCARCHAFEDDEAQGMQAFYYVLEGDAVREVRFLEYIQWRDATERLVAWTEIIGRETVAVFTCFNGAQIRRPGAPGLPNVFQTRLLSRVGTVLDFELAGVQLENPDKRLAVAAHWRVVEVLRARLNVANP